MPRITGWIFDAYPLSGGMSLWVLDENGRMHALRDDWRPRLFVRTDHSDALDQALRRLAIPTRRRLVERRDFFTQGAVAVWELRVENPLQYQTLVNPLMTDERLELFNCDIAVVQAYHYERGHF